MPEGKKDVGVVEICLFPTGRAKHSPNYSRFLLNCQSLRPMKKILLILLPFLICSQSFAQDIRLKRKKVRVGDEVVMTYKKFGLGGAIHLKCLEHQKTIVCIAIKNVEKNRNWVNNYTRIEFGKGKVVNTTLKMGFKEWVMLMDREGIFTADWELDMDAVAEFIQKHEREIQ